MKITSQMRAIAKAAAIETYKAILKSATVQSSGNPSVDNEYKSILRLIHNNDDTRRICTLLFSGDEEDDEGNPKPNDDLLVFSPSQIAHMKKEFSNKAWESMRQERFSDKSNAADKKDPKDKDKGTCPTGVPLCS